ncbi:hypothetical protein PVAP13_7NG093200 [Panicum virgatum]|uniref:Uncharacterized protein n=1 Tax=Panicum virgatum TaxID=38727 RepID=A0A8T0PR50_PANVG|nr:hypothetical protein PVAP13_7NG093200 [Panicum virgatum]
MWWDAAVKKGARLACATPRPVEMCATYPTPLAAVRHRPLCRLQNNRRLHLHEQRTLYPQPTRPPDHHASSPNRPFAWLARAAAPTSSASASASAPGLGFALVVASAPTPLRLLPPSFAGAPPPAPAQARSHLDPVPAPLRHHPRGRAGFPSASAHHPRPHPPKPTPLHGGAAAPLEVRHLLGAADVFISGEYASAPLVSSEDSIHVLCPSLGLLSSIDPHRSLGAVGFRLSILSSRGHPTTSPLRLACSRRRPHVLRLRLRLRLRAVRLRLRPRPRPRPCRRVCADAPPPAPARPHLRLLPPSCAGAPPPAPAQARSHLDPAPAPLRHHPRRICLRPRGRAGFASSRALRLCTPSLVCPPPPSPPTPLRGGAAAPLEVRHLLGAADVFISGEYAPAPLRFL